MPWIISRGRGGAGGLRLALWSPDLAGPSMGFPSGLRACAHSCKSGGPREGAALGKDPPSREVHGALARMTGEGFALEETNTARGAAPVEEISLQPCRHRHSAQNGPPRESPRVPVDMLTRNTSMRTTLSENAVAFW
ncbi:hypothetical protein V1279_003014 [Bradyrhizobium sp. AZCC 1610]